VDFLRQVVIGHNPVSHLTECGQSERRAGAQAATVPPNGYLGRFGLQSGLPVGYGGVSQDPVITHHPTPKSMTATHLALALSLLLSAPVAAQTSAVSSRMQGNEADPFRGRYLLGASSEMALFRADPAVGTVHLDLFDANSVVEDGLRLTDRLTVAGDWGLSEFHSARLDAVTADMNGDGFDAIIAAWERPNHDVTLFTAEVDAASLTISEESRLSLHDLGFPLMFEYSSGSQIHRQIRLATGRLLNEPGEQIVLAYFAADEEEESGPIQIVVFGGGSNQRSSQSRPSQTNAWRRSQAIHNCSEGACSTSSPAT
jgi:hypothetical protein